jgi:hypothetical protein
VIGVDRIEGLAGEDEEMADDEGSQEQEQNQEITNDEDDSGAEE